VNKILTLLEKYRDEQHSAGSQEDRQHRSHVIQAMINAEEQEKEALQQLVRRAGGGPYERWQIHWRQEFDRRLNRVELYRALGWYWGSAAHSSILLRFARQLSE
jgi:hypothetical protein